MHWLMRCFFACTIGFEVRVHESPACLSRDASKRRPLWELHVICGCRLQGRSHGSLACVSRDAPKLRQLWALSVMRGYRLGGSVVIRLERFVWRDNASIEFAASSIRVRCPSDSPPPPIAGRTRAFAIVASLGGSVALVVVGRPAPPDCAAHARACRRADCVRGRQARDGHVRAAPADARPVLDARVRVGPGG